MIGANLAQGSKTARRRALDFYPTPPEVTVALMDFLNIPRGSLIWEPACGDGAMSKVLHSYGHKVYSSDLRTTGFGEGDVDFLTAPLRPVDAIITNPPFALAHKFIERALLQTTLVAMVLKSQYWHAAKRQSLLQQNPPAYVLPLTWRPDFLSGERGGAPTMECLWTVWIRGVRDARYLPLPRPRMLDPLGALL